MLLIGLVSTTFSPMNATVLVLLLNSMLQLWLSVQLPAAGLWKCKYSILKMSPASGWSPCVTVPGS